MSERFVSGVCAKIALYKYTILYFLSFPFLYSNCSLMCRARLVYVVSGSLQETNALRLMALSRRRS